jgi:hypothetical protein
VISARDGGEPDAPDLENDWITVTDHSYTRWRQRAETTGIGPRAAYYAAITLDVEEHGPTDHDEYLYHHPSRTVLVVDRDVPEDVATSGELVTVYHADNLRPRLARALAVLGGEPA